MEDGWEILPNGMLSKASLKRLRETHKQAAKEMEIYRNSEEFKEYSKEKDKQLKEELEKLRKARQKLK